MASHFDGVRYAAECGTPIIPEAYFMGFDVSSTCGHSIISKWTLDPNQGGLRLEEVVIS